MSTEIKCECLDILCDILHKYGNLMQSDHEGLIGALLPQLSSNQASIRKKTVSCIGKIKELTGENLYFKKKDMALHGVCLTVAMSLGGIQSLWIEDAFF